MGDSFQYENAPADKIVAYYTGTDTLREGYVLCYDYDRTDTDGDGNTIYYKRAYMVEQATANNSPYFAGFVAEESDGMTGPGEVYLIPPGSRMTIGNVWTNSNLSAGTELFTDPGTYTAKPDADAAADGMPIAVVSVAKDTSSTAGQTVCWVGNLPQTDARYTVAS